MPDEAMLIEQAKSFDPDAWAEIYNRYYHRVYIYICSNVGDTYLAEEMATAVFLGAVERIGTFRSRGVSLTVWLYRIAHNVLTDHLHNIKRAG